MFFSRLLLVFMYSIGQDYSELVILNKLLLSKTKYDNISNYPHRESENIFLEIYQDILGTSIFSLLGVHELVFL